MFTPPAGYAQDFRDPRVCQDFLLGLCPHTLFVNTKDDLGPCPRQHDDALRRAYEDAAKTQRFGYERAHERRLESLIAEAERRISRARERTDDDSAAVPRLDVDTAPEVAEISKDIAERIKASEAAGEAGEVEKSQTLLEEAEALRRRKAAMQAQLVHKHAADEATRTAAGTLQSKQRLRVCDICGAFLSLNDSDERLADHFGGRVHLGFLAIREKLAALRAAHAAAAAAAAPIADRTSDSERPPRSHGDRDIGAPMPYASRGRDDDVRDGGRYGGRADDRAPYQPQGYSDWRGGSGGGVDRRYDARYDDSRRGGSSDYRRGGGVGSDSWGGGDYGRGGRGGGGSGSDRGGSSYGRDDRYSRGYDESSRRRRSRSRSPPPPPRGRPAANDPRFNDDDDEYTR